MENAPINIQDLAILIGSKDIEINQLKLQLQFAHEKLQDTEKEKNNIQAKFDAYIDSKDMPSGQVKPKDEFAGD